MKMNGDMTAIARSCLRQCAFENEGPPPGNVGLFRRRFRQAGITTGFGQKAVGCVQHPPTSSSVGLRIEVSRYNKRNAKLHAVVSLNDKANKQRNDSSTEAQIVAWFGFAGRLGGREQRRCQAAQSEQHRKHVSSSFPTTTAFSRRPISQGKIRRNA